MPAIAVAFPQIVLAIHIAAVVAGFGVVFSYPIYLLGARIDPRAMPWFHRMQEMIGQRLISPGLVVILAAGIYLASKEHQWSAFYVQWGIGVVVVLGGLGGAFFGPSEKKLGELAQRDVAAAAGGEASWSAEYLALRRRVEIVSGAAGVLVLVTIYLMTVHAGA